MADKKSYLGLVAAAMDTAPGATQEQVVEMLESTISEHTKMYQTWRDHLTRECVRIF